MTSTVNRRGFLGGAAAAGAGIAVAGSVDVLAGSGSALAAPRSSAGYGPLVPDPKGVLSLPAAFSYRIVSETGVTATTDGVLTASDPDANGVFPRAAVPPSSTTTRSAAASPMRCPP